MCKKNILTIILMIFIVTSCSTNQEVIEPKVNTVNTDIPTTTQTAIQGKKNQFDLKLISNLVLLNQSVSLPARKSNNYKSLSLANFFFTDNSGDITSLKIPNSKTYTLNVSSIMECTKDFVLVSGNLNIEYLDGTKDNLNNFILDKTDGSFYKLSDASYAQFNNIYSKRYGSSPWVNGKLQFDDNNSVYLKGNNTGIIQEIYKAEFNKTSSETIDVKFTTINLIAEGNYFNYYIMPNGDILYLYKENMGKAVWKVRFGSGQTISIVDLDQNSSFSVNNVKYFESVDTSSCFGVRSSNNEFIFFIKGQETQNFTNTQLPNYIKPFKLTTNNGTVIFESIPSKILASDNYLNAQFTLFTDYTHGMWYFNSNNFHVFTNRGYADTVKGNIWWSFDDKTNTFKTSYTNYSNAEFTTYSQLLGSSSKFACVPIGQNVHFVDLENLTNNTITNLGFQIFKTQYRNDDVLQFYGISYSSGKKVYGEINQAGTVKILNEFENTTVEVTDIIKIGNF